MTIIFPIVMGIGIIISLTIAGVLLHDHRRQKKAEKLLAGFKSAAEEYKLTIADTDTFRNRVIGLDDVQNKLLYLTLTGNKLDGYLVDLDEVKSIRVNKTYGSVQHNDEEADVYIKNISLQLSYKNGAKPLVLPFYLRDTDPKAELRQREEQAKAWQTLVSAHLGKSSPAKTTNEKAGHRYA